MRSTIGQLATRLIPAVFTATGVMLLAAGLLSYGSPVVANDPLTSPSPAVVEPSPSPPPSMAPSSPDVSQSPSPSPSAPGALATRVVIPALRVDLPVIPPNDGYPLCDVAQYLDQLHQPGEAGATYIYAHARAGMFLPLLDESKRDAGSRMLGMLVQVYTADDRVHLYEITEVLPVVPFDEALVRPFAATSDQLWLQTSIGPKGTKPKLQVVAMPVSVSAADPADAHPTPKPVVCGP
jgi:hypothetical protein